MKIKKTVGPRFLQEDFLTSSACPPARWVCLGVAIRPDMVAIRNTSDPKKVTIKCTREEWAAFLIGVKNNEFDLK